MDMFFVAEACAHARWVNHGRVVVVVDDGVLAGLEHEVEVAAVRPARPSTSGRRPATPRARRATSCRFTRRGVPSACASTSAGRARSVVARNEQCARFRDA